MASGLTNRGKIRLLEMAFRNTKDTAAIDTSPLFISLVTIAVSLCVDTTTQIVTGNGYTDGGLDIDRDTVDWDTLAISSATAYGYIRLKDVVWTASGGSIPASGNGAA